MKKILFAAAIVAAAFTAPTPAPAHADHVCQDYPNRVEASDDTTCDFALTVARSYMYGHNGPNFSAYSDTSHEGYQIHCMIEQHGSTTCRSTPGTAVVIIY